MNRAQLTVGGIMAKYILRIAASLSLFIFVPAIAAQSMFDKINDFDGDGRADFAITRAEGGLKIWHIWQTTGGHRQVHWGLDTDINAPGDMTRTGDQISVSSEEYLPRRPRRRVIFTFG